MATDPSDKHVEAARTRLVHLAGLSARTHAAEQRILDAAEHRLESVDRDIATLRPRVNLSDEAAQQYQDLHMERGQLVIVIAKARQVLGL
jgi:hypothetical protein